MKKVGRHKNTLLLSFCQSKYLISENIRIGIGNTDYTAAEQLILAVANYRFLNKRRIRTMMVLASSIDRETNAELYQVHLAIWYRCTIGNR